MFVIVFLGSSFAGPMGAFPRVDLELSLPHRYPPAGQRIPQHRPQFSSSGLIDKNDHQIISNDLQLQVEP